MKVSAEWIKKLFSFASKREKTSLTGEADSSHEKNVDEAVEKPGLHKRLVGLFRRGKFSTPEEGETAGQDEPQTVSEIKAQSDAEVVSPIDEAGNSEEAGVLSKTGIFTRLMGIFKRRKKFAEAEAGEENAGQVAEKKDDEHPGAEVVPKKGLWTRLSAVFKRKSGEQLVSDLEGADELFSWGEGQAPAPVAGKAAKIEKGKKDEKDDVKTTDRKDSVEVEEPPLPGFGARIGALVRKKKVWVSLLLAIIGMVVFLVSLTVYQMRSREHARMLVLEKKNKQLQEENKKLRVFKKQAVTQQAKMPPDSSPVNPAGNSGAGAGQDSSDDCTVKNKASAAEVLKRCIDNFNATDRH